MLLTKHKLCEEQLASKEILLQTQTSKLLDAQENAYQLQQTVGQLKLQMNELNNELDFMKQVNRMNANKAADSGANGRLVYDIVKGDPRDMFKMDADSGRIMVNQSLDYEEVPVYNVIVQATDSGYYAKSATASVKIVLQDVNDNVPRFEGAVIRAGVRENSPSGSTVTQVIAVDLDSPKHGQVVYSIVERQRDFAIDSNTGIVTSLRPFDYESVSSFVLTVRAKNPDSDEHSEARLAILVEGENEFVPKFRQPVFQFAVSEASTVGSTIGQVSLISFVNRPLSTN